MAFEIKATLGAVFRELPRYVLLLLGSREAYLSLRNRHERLDHSLDGRGYRCDWQWTSDLHAPKLLPFLGRWLMRRALADHPVRRLSRPESVSEHPDVSFIVGHRGLARLPHLLATLESIAGQQGVGIECIVVEQETISQLSGKLPVWIRHIHTPPPAADMPYCRSWAFNIGVTYACGRVLVLHDNDMLVSEDYAEMIVDRINQGYEVVNLKRFIFYLNEVHTDRVFGDEATILDEAPETIVQNLEAGGSVAITNEAYERIGGMDESFIGWGGEDNEFWERAQTCKVWPYGCLPLVHLWHQAQPGKYQAENPTLLHYRDLSLMPVVDRIVSLTSKPRGNMAGPSVYMSKGLQIFDSAGM